MNVLASQLLGFELRDLLVAAGVGQLALGTASIAIPRVLGWRPQIATLPRFTQQVFWSYAAYIFGSHIAFGLVSALVPHWLLDDGPLGRAVCGFIGIWWAARFLIGLLYHDHSGLPQGRGVWLTYWGLQLVFGAWAAGYLYLAFRGAG